MCALCVCLGYKGAGEPSTAVTGTRHDGSFPRVRLRVNAKLAEILVGLPRDNVLRLWTHRRHHKDNKQGDEHACRGAWKMWSPESMLHLGVVKPAWASMLGHGSNQMFDPHLCQHLQRRHRIAHHQHHGLG